MRLTTPLRRASKEEFERLAFTRATLQKLCPCENENKNTQNGQKERESFTHAWPHLCMADPSKDGDQNIPEVLAPKMKTEEQQQQQKVKRREENKKRK